MKPKNPIDGIKARIAQRKDYKSKMEQYKKDLAEANRQANPRDLGGTPPRMPLSPRQQKQVAKGKDINKPASKKKESSLNYTVNFNNTNNKRGKKANYDMGASELARKRNKKGGMSTSCKKVVRFGRNK
jgi:hypothetical protein